MNDIEEYELRTQLTHNQQILEFGWCMCEDGGHISEGCDITHN